MKRWIGFMIIALTVLAMTACGDAEIDESFVWPESIDGQNPFYGETLTIGAGWNRAQLTRVVGAYMWANPGVNIEIVNYGDDWAASIERMGIEMMAGIAPMLIDSTLVDYLNPATAMLLADWLPIMAAAPSFNEDDWFTNVFDAFMADGRLHVFPTNFYYRFVQANYGIAGLVQALEAKDGITTAQMQELHREFGDATTHLYFDMNFNTVRAVLKYLDHFLDIGSGMVDFNNQHFIDLITYSRDITAPGSMLNPLDSHRWWGYTRSMEREWAQRYFFLDTLGPIHFHYYLDIDAHRSFVSPTPLTNNYGELIIEVSEGFLLNAGATQIQKALAWDFIYFVSNYPYDRVQGGWFRMQPTNRNLLRATVERRLPNARASFVRQGWLYQDDEHNDIESVIAQMTAFAEMPMSNVDTPVVISNAIVEVLEQFHDGLITAEQAAIDLQNRVTLIVMEMD